MEQMAMTIKIEVEVAATAHVDSEIDLNSLKRDPGLLQSVKRELSFTNDVLVKAEILEDSTQDDSKQLCVHGASRVAGTGDVNAAAYSASLGDLLNVKIEPAEMDIGPTVVQHMDTHYTINKSTVDGCNKAMRWSRVNKSVEHKLRGNKINYDHCSQRTTEEDYDEAHLKSCLGQQQGIQENLLLQHQTTSLNCFRCSACDEIFHKPDLLSAHRKLHERNSATSGATSRSAGGASNVRRSEAAKAEPQPFKCGVCNNEYSSAGNLSRHKRLHFGVGISVCHICSAKFNMKSNLTKHLRTHTGEKPYQCDICNARFARNDLLTTHKRVHSGEKPYQCDICNAKFTTSGHLTTHKRVHTGEKPYLCDICNERFTTSSSLTRHKRVHTDEKPFECTECGSKFTQKGNLNKHVRSRHPK